MNFFHLYDQMQPVRHGWPFVYFHGALEDQMAAQSRMPPDLVAGDTSPDAVADGVYDVGVYGEKAKLFFWSGAERDFVRLTWSPFQVRETGRKPHRTGLVVLATDESSLAYAQRLFEAKQEHL